MPHSRFIGLTYWRINVRKEYDIVGSYNNQRVNGLDTERTVNMFEYLDPKSKRQKALISTSGLINTNLVFLPETNGSRATFVFNGIIYEIFGGTVFKITPNPVSGSLTNVSIGSLGNSLGYAAITANPTQLLIVDGERGYIYSTTSQKFVQILDPGFPARPIDATSLDGFFIVPSGDTNTFYMNTINQGLVWSEVNADIASVDTASYIITFATAANYQTMTPIVFSGAGTPPTGLVLGDTYYVIRISATQIQIATSEINSANGIPIALGAGFLATITATNNGQLQAGSITSQSGNIVACKTLHRRLFLFSSNFTEVWENAGKGTNLPLRRTNSLLMEVGTPAIGSVVVGFDRMFFLSQDQDGLGSVMQVIGTESVPVSTRALDYQLAQYASDVTLGVSDARGILIKENGLIFYRLNFTRANHTFVFNVSMSDGQNLRWHEEELLGGNRHPAQTHAYCNGVNYYGHYNQAIFYQVSPTTSNNAGEAIKRMRIGAPVADPTGNRLRMDRFYLDLLQGAVAPEILDEANLDAESSEDLLTEQSENILLEQQVVISGGGAPTVYFSYSKNGGISYGNILEGSMGKIGERTFRTVWRKLGTVPRGQSFIPKIEFYAEIPFIIFGGAWDFEVLPE